MTPRKSHPSPTIRMGTLVLLGALWGVVAGTPAEEIPRAGGERPPLADQLEGTFSLLGLDPYPYDAGNRRDPFTPMFPSSSQGGIPKSQSVQSQTLGYDFQLLGIMSGKHGYRALIQLGDGHGAIVGIGTRIGPDQGRVKKITDQAVVIEISSEREGTGVPFQRVLRLHSGE